jgi:hypothetical protein
MRHVFRALWWVIDSSFYLQVNKSDHVALVHNYISQSYIIEGDAM